MSLNTYISEIKFDIKNRHKPRVRFDNVAYKDMGALKLFLAIKTALKVFEIVRRVDLDEKCTLEIDLF